MTRNERQQTPPPRSRASAGVSRGGTPEIVAPHRWCGEGDCLVGPFTNAQIAWTFAGLGLSRGAYEVHHFELHHGARGVYLKVTRADMT